MDDDKEEIIAKIQEILGRLPSGTRFVLNAIVHPDVIELTKEYVRAHDEASRCQKYEAPWSCAKEAEARYENIKYGWLGAGSGVGYSEWWCDPCKKRVLEG